MFAREIRKAEQQVVVRSIEDVEIFIALNRMTSSARECRMPYSAELVRRLDAACSARGVRRILLAEGADGTPACRSLSRLGRHRAPTT